MPFRTLAAWNLKTIKALNREKFVALVIKTQGKAHFNKSAGQTSSESRSIAYGI
jgi:hypothetical protein